ncbi:alanine racemase [Sphingomonas sp. ASY06-1R]|uniref:alanine racemase n=1 Tax=Sphingomonas sp. ASY06-1R TaxID=3445771 RepID=UPI003FA335FC
MTLPPTPCLVLDRDALDRNIARMAAFAKVRGLRLRPHAKTHKSRAIAARQAKAGAVGICCATLWEAEQLAGAAPSILLTSPVAGAASAARIAALLRRQVALSVVVDHPAFLAALDGQLPADAPLGIVIDIDPGMGRSGVAAPQDAVALARAVSARPDLRYDGIQFYCGSEQHIPTLAARKDAIAARNLRLAETIAALAAAGLPPPVVTGGGTGTHGIDADAGLLTELQPGSYIFMDQDYGACELGGAGPFETALQVHATVVSANHAGWVTIDAGIKALATDSGQPLVTSGISAGSAYRFTGDEFGRLDLPADAPQPMVGSRIVLTASHCDPTVNLHDIYHLTGAALTEASWPIDARGHGDRVSPG